MDYKEQLYKYNQPNLRACQLKQLEILKDIDKACRKMGISYWLDGGTLLGAVRHGGFIPWDDDIDIAMDVKDLHRFVKEGQAYLPQNLMIQSRETNPQVRAQNVKVRDLNSLYIEKVDNFIDDYEKGIYVDIFPFDRHPNAPKAWIKRLSIGITKSSAILNHSHRYSLRAVAEFFWFGGKKLLYTAQWRVLMLCCKSTRYADIPSMNGYGITHDRSTVLPLGKIRFEDTDFPAPHDPDQYLKNIYKDYMTIPPVEKRHFHAILIIPDLKVRETGK
jgi:lipopolysaccharide cholinephosphotransferase